MQLQGEIDDFGFCPSFNCYSSDSLTSMAAVKVSREFKQEQAAQFHEFSDNVDEEDFEFSLVLAGEEVSGKELALESRRFVFPVFNSDLLIKDEVDRAVEESDDASSVRIQLQKLFVDDREESPSSSSSEADESEGRPSGTFCVYRPEADVGSPTLTKCKKSSSTGSGSKKWRIRDLLRRSNSEGKELIFFLCPKKAEASKQKRNVKSGEVPKVAGKLKTPASPSFHELFYVQKRAEKEGNKMKSYLPYRQDLLGFFANVNMGIYKKLPF